MTDRKHPVDSREQTLIQLSSSGANVHGPRNGSCSDSYCQSRTDSSSSCNPRVWVYDSNVASVVANNTSMSPISDTCQQ